jgi:uncharacterized lipoprotein YddW (UPF0748 family)
MRKRTIYRPLLALILTLFVLLSLGSVAEPPTAQPPSVPPEPTVSAATVGRNEAWYIEQGYADGSTDLPPIEPAHFPSPTPSARVQISGDLNHHCFLPLVENPESEEEEESHENAEARALWVTRWDYRSAADVETLIANAAGAGFNVVLFQVRGTADAFYASSLEPWAARLSGTLGQNPGWDPLQTAVNAAHTHGIELHAYINVYPVWVGAERPTQYCYPQHLYWTLSNRYWGVDPRFPSGAWRVYGSNYEPMMLNSHYLYVTPAIPDMDEHIAAVANDIISRYAVDGVHLDLVRYPGPGYSYDPTTEAALAQGNISRADWQRQRVTQLVSRVYSEAILPRPEVQLSAAVWPVYKNHWGWNASEGYHDYYQDSQGWVESGVIDAILPMIYPVDVSQSPDAFTKDHFTLLTSDFLDNDGGRHVLPGISAQYHSFDEIAQRIEIARNLGAPGHAIFSARLVIGDYPCADRLPCHDPYWDDFAAGPYADEAELPPLSWRQ